MSDRQEERVERVDELEISVHHRIRGPDSAGRPEYEIHPGFADVLEVPKRLVEAVKTQTGVDIRTDEVRCGAEIRVVEDG